MCLVFFDNDELHQGCQNGDPQHLSINIYLWRFTLLCKCRHSCTNFSKFPQTAATSCAVNCWLTTAHYSHKCNNQTQLNESFLIPCGPREVFLLVKWPVAEMSLTLLNIPKSHVCWKHNIMISGLKTWYRISVIES